MEIDEMEKELIKLKKYLDDLQTKIVKLDTTIQEKLLPIGFWYDRKKLIWFMIEKIINYNKDYIEILYNSGDEVIAKQDDCIIFKHPHRLRKIIERKGF